MGVRTVVDGSYKSHGYAIQIMGKDCYVAGFGAEDSGFAPAYRQYITVVYNGAGSLRSNFPDYWTIHNAATDTALSAAPFRAGQIFVTGRIDNGSDLDDAGTLYYAGGASLSAASGFTVDVGTQTLGNLASLGSDDGNPLEIQNDPTQPSTAPKIVCTVTGNVGTGVSAISLTVVAHAVANTNQEIQVYNWTSGAYETLDFRASPLVDLPLYLAVPGNPDDYVDGSGNVKMRINYYNAGAVTPNWKGSIDQIGWEYLN